MPQEGPCNDTVGILPLQNATRRWVCRSDSALATPGGAGRSILDEDPLGQQLISNLVCQRPFPLGSSSFSPLNQLLLTVGQGHCGRLVLDEDDPQDLITVTQEFEGSQRP